MPSIAMIALLLAAWGSSASSRVTPAHPTKPQGGRDLLDPRRLRAQGRRRPRRGRDARRARRRRPCLFADPGRRPPPRRRQGLRNGLGFEGWMGRLVGNPPAGQGPVVEAAKDAKPIKAGGARPACAWPRHVDPHAWQSVANVKIYVANIRDALIAADPAGKAVYEANAAAYLAQLDALDAEVKAASRASRRIAAASSRRTTPSAISSGPTARFRGPAGRLDGGRGLRQGRRPHHPADPAGEDPGGVPGEHLRPAPHRAHRQETGARIGAGSIPTPSPARTARRPLTST